MSSGSVSLDSFTENKLSPIKAIWFSQASCGNCGVRFPRVRIENRTQDEQTSNEIKCLHCGEVNRLD